MKIKIAFLVPEIKNCGPINVVFSIIQNLDLTQFEIMLISVRNNNSDYKDIVKDRCVLGFYSLENHSLEELTQNIDVVHSHGYYPDKLLANLKNKSMSNTSIILAKNKVIL